MKLKLVDEWHKCWKWASVQLAALSAVAFQLYQQVPQFQTYIPPKLFNIGMTAMVGLIILGRVLEFAGKDDAKSPPQ